MPFFKVVAERSLGIYAGGIERLTASQVFAIRDVFDPNLRQRIARRTWDRMECADEDEVRSFFAQAQAEKFDDLHLFEIVSIERVE